MKRGSFVRRSTLIMPVNRSQFVKNSWLRGADAIQLDLEDGLADSEKAEARGFVQEAIATAGQGGGTVLVRINNNRSELAKDLEASIFPGLHGIVIPKVESVREVKGIEEIIASLERRRGLENGSIKISLLIETAKGFLHMQEITNASYRIETINLGTEDFVLDLEIQKDDRFEPLSYPKMQTIITARAAGLQPLGLFNSMTNFRNLQGLYENAQKSYRYGFKGASCIHPTQVSVLNQAFSPTSVEIEYAKRVVEVYEEAKGKGHGATSLEGVMIDRPIVIRAQRLLAYQQAIERLEQKKVAAIESVRKGQKDGDGKGGYYDG